MELICFRQNSELLKAMMMDGVSTAVGAKRPRRTEPLPVINRWWTWTTRKRRTGTPVIDAA